MIRVFLVHLLLFALPFILYAGYFYLAKRQKQGKLLWKDAPLFGMVMAGLALTAAGFLVFAVFTGAEPDKTYYPAEIRDGKIQPGRIE